MPNTRRRDAINVIIINTSSWIQIRQLWNKYYEKITKNFIPIKIW